VPVLDTSILISLLKGDSDTTRKIGSLEEDGIRLSTTVITAYELLKGARISSKPEENTMRVRDSISRLQILGLSLGACEEASRIYKDLKERGRMISEFDILIAAITKFSDDELITRDEHFKSISRMRIIKWYGTCNHKRSPPLPMQRCTPATRPIREAAEPPSFGSSGRQL